jgi:peptide/nickel transport system substrate-binding protein
MKRTLTTVTIAALIAVSAAACSGGNTSRSSNHGSSSEQGSGKTLVVDQFFDVKTLDPDHCFEFTCTSVDRQTYQSALKFDNGHPAKPVPNLASYKLSHSNKVLTLSMKKGAKFADGSPVTADDVVFSYKRLKGLKDNPAFLLDGVTIKKVNDNTIKLTSKKPNPELPYILPNPSLGIVNSHLVKQHGGSTTKQDKAKKYLDFHSAGSGPYIIKSYEPKSKVVLTSNPRYNGSKPKYGRVVIRNAKGPTQKVDIQSGTANLAMNLSPDQIKSLQKSKVNIFNTPGTRSIYLFMNQDASVNNWTANRDFMDAIKSGINYKKLAKAAGGGAKRLGGIVPTAFPGALKAQDGPKYNPKKAKAKIKASGYNGSAIPFYYPNDVTVGGIELQHLVVPLQAELKHIGVKIKLKPGPSGTAISPYRAGKDAMGMWYWGSDYPDPSDYLVFGPDGNVGKRAKWSKSNAASSVLRTMHKAKSASPSDNRAKKYKIFQEKMNELGPFVPLIEPARNIVTTKSIKSMELNASGGTLRFATVK